MPPITSSAPLNQIVTPRPAFPATQPLTVVPTMNAAEPDARSHPYSNRRLPSDSLSCAAVVASASDSGAIGANIAAWSSPTASKLAKTLHHQVTQSGYGRRERTSAQDRCVSMQTISGMTNRGTGKNADRRGGGEDDADLFRVQPLFPEQSWQER